MAEKKLYEKLIYPVFGKRFGFWDVVLIALVIPYVWMIYHGITVEGGWRNIYFRMIGPSLAFAVVSKVVIQNILKGAKGK